MSEDIIDRLSRDLRPVRTLSNRLLWSGAAAVAVLTAAYVFLLYGARPELAALLRGAAGHPMAWVKPVLFLVIAASALWSVTDLARPEGRLRLRTLAPAIAVTGVVAGTLVADVAEQGVTALWHVSDPSRLCVVTVLCGGVVGLVVMWRFWLRRTATSHPALLGAMSGLAAGSLMAAAYAIHCRSDAPAYILGIYGGAVAVVTLAAAVLGRRLLRW